MRAIAIALTAMVAAALPVLAEPTALLEGPNAVKWGPAPPNLPKGAMLAVLAGDPSKNGPYVVRLKMPADYKIPSHHHPTAENVTVLSGRFHAGMGDTFDATKASVLSPGGFASMPAGMNHYAWASGETIVQVHGDGPFAIIYANPADDPSR